MFRALMRLREDITGTPNLILAGLGPLGQRCWRRGGAVIAALQAQA